MIAVVDVIRFAVVVGAALIAAAVLSVLVRARAYGMTRYQMARFGALLVASCNVVLTVTLRLGTTPTWRLPLNALFVAFGLYGVSRLVSNPVPPRRGTQLTIRTEDDEPTAGETR